LVTAAKVAAQVAALRVSKVMVNTGICKVVGVDVFYPV
jgi:hypothetical protein